MIFKKRSYSKEHSDDVIDSLQDKETIGLIWSWINKIEPEVYMGPKILESGEPAILDNEYYDELDDIHKIINSDGHRGPEFIDNVDILFAGCSQTYGQGVKDGTIWGELVAKELGLSYNNLSYRGGSVMQIIYNIFNYCQKHGNPKYMLCMFPAFTRSYVFLDSKILSSGKKSRKGPYKVSQISLGNKYIKLPAEAEQVIPNEHRVWLNFMFISMLETYCKANNIKLIWTTWQNLYGNDKELLKENFKNFLILKKNWNQTIYPNERDLGNYNRCHQKIKHDYEDFFDRGTDWNQTDSKEWDGHWGAHTHIHVYENFINEIKRREFIEEIKRNEL